MMNKKGRALPPCALLPPLAEPGPQRTILGCPRALSILRGSECCVASRVSPPPPSRLPSVVLLQCVIFCLSLSLLCLLPLESPTSKSPSPRPGMRSVHEGNTGRQGDGDTVSKHGHLRAEGEAQWVGKIWKSRWKTRRLCTYRYEMVQKRLKC